MRINISESASVVFFVMLLSSFSVLAKPGLVLNTWAEPPLSIVDQTGYLDQIVIEAFRRLDLAIDIVKKPVERSILDANHGIGDGEFIRISGLSETYQNLVQVPEAIFEFEFVVFTKKHDVVVNGWDSLKPYSVGIVIGWKILEQKVKHARRRSDVPTPQSLFKMLAGDRIEVAVYARYLGAEIVHDMGLSNIVPLSPPLAVKPMYLYLHKKHRNLVPLVAQKLRDMKKDGTFLKIKNEYLLKK